MAQHAFHLQYKQVRQLDYRQLMLRDFDLRQRHWRTFSPRAIQVLILLLGSLLWVGTYGWLVLRFWRYGIADLFAGSDAIGLGLTVASIGLGVPLLLAWRAVGQQWLDDLNRPGERRWAALSPKKAYGLSPAEFEEYVAQRIFARQGYHVHNTPDVKDGGIDILVTDPHGHTIVVQCKRYGGTVGSATVRELYGTMIHEGAVHAFLVTTGRISSDARLWAEGKPMFLMDGEQLASLARSRPGTLSKLFSI